MAKLLARWGLLINDTMAPTADHYVYRTYKVQLYVNERLTKIPDCASTTCLFSKFAAFVKPIVETCDLDAICENPPAY